MSTVRYSNLCETSEGAYTEYTRAVIAEYELARAIVARGGVVASGVGRAIVARTVGQDKDGVGGFVDRRTLLGDGVSFLDGGSWKECCTCNGGNGAGHDEQTITMDGVQTGDGSRISDDVVSVAGGDGRDAAVADDLHSRRVGGGMEACVVGGADVSAGVVAGSDELSSSVGVGAQSGSDGVRCEAVIGRHSRKNRAKREKAKLARAQVKVMQKQMETKSAAGVDEGYKSGSSACSGGAVHVGSSRTVDARTDVEIEAAQTLAVRRVEENKVKIAEAKVAARLAEHRLKALNDKERSVAIDRLAAARLEEKINTARSKSQESFKKCDESLKSLGSSGSAGEFALKMQIKDAKDNEQILKFVRQQLDYVSKHVSPEVLDAMGRHVKPPVLQEEFDAFGDCPSDYDEDECEAYYGELNRRNDKAAMFEALW